MDDNSRFFFVLTAVGAAVAVGSRWLFPFYSYIFGGAFFIAYLIVLFGLGMPILLLEFGIGQHFRKNVVDIFYSIRSWTGIMGWFMLINAFILMCIYVARLSWTIVYIFVSLGFQWKGRAESYFFNNVLQASSTEYASFSIAIFVALVLSWLTIFPLIKNGFESIKKYFVVVLSAIAFMSVSFMVYTLTLDGSLTGIYSMFRFDIRQLFLPQVWLAAFSLAITSLGISFGLMQAISQKSEGFILRSAFLVIVFEYLSGIILGFIVLSLLGMLSVKQGIPLNVLVSSDYASTFTILAESLPFLYRPTFLSVLFFAFLALFLIVGAASLAYSLVNVLTRKLNTQNRNAAILVVGFGFLFGLLFAVKPGYYILDIVNHYLYYNILIAVLLEAVAVGWIYNIKKVKSYLDSVSFIKIGFLWSLVIRYIVPLLILVLIFIQARIDWHGYKNYSWWALLSFGMGTIAVPLVIAFLLPRKMMDKARK